jgi:hypothetical protein
MTRKLVNEIAAVSIKRNFAFTASPSAIGNQQDFR